MIIYNTKTLNEYYQTVLINYNLLRSAEDLDQDTIVNLANSTLKEIVSITMPFFNWYGISSIPIINGTVLPREYVRKISLYGSEDNNYVECRYVASNEYYAVTEASRGQKWNLTRTTTPVFTIWGHEEIVGVTPVQEPILKIYTTLAGEGIFNFYSMPQYLVGLNSIVPITIDMDLLFNYGLLSRLFFQLGMNEQGEIAFSEFNNVLQSYLMSYSEKITTEQKELIDYLYPSINAVPEPPIEGEVPGTMLPARN